MQRAGALLMTGATGRLGRALLVRLAREGPASRDVYLLVRRRSGRSGPQRVRAAVRVACGSEEAARWMRRVRVVEGDLTTPGLGLGRACREELHARVGQILHIAACTDARASVAQLQATNAGGTRRVLQLASAIAAEGPKAPRLDYVSTARVAGMLRGTLHEEQLELGQGFYNAYERSKHEAERLVRSARGQLPVVIYRPSFMLDPRVHREPLPLVAKGLRARLLRRAGVFDAVTVDWVADAIAALAGDAASIGRCYHLARGSGAEMRPGRLRPAAGRARVDGRELAWFVLFDLLAGTGLTGLFPDRFLELSDRAAPHGAYLHGVPTRIDTRATDRALCAQGVRTGAGGPSDA